MAARPTCGGIFLLLIFKVLKESHPVCLPSYLQGVSPKVILVPVLSVPVLPFLYTFLY